MMLILLPRNCAVAAEVVLLVLRPMQLPALTIQAEVSIHRATTVPTTQLTCQVKVKENADFMIGWSTTVAREKSLNLLLLTCVAPAMSTSLSMSGNGRLVLPRNAET